MALCAPYKTSCRQNKAFLRTRLASSEGRQRIPRTALKLLQNITSAKFTTENNRKSQITARCSLYLGEWSWRHTEPRLEGQTTAVGCCETEGCTVVRTRNRRKTGSRGPVNKGERQHRTHAYSGSNAILYLEKLCGHIAPSYHWIPWDDFEAEHVSLAWILIVIFLLFLPGILVSIDESWRK